MLKKIISIPLGCYLTVMCCLYFFQEKMIYSPSTTDFFQCTIFKQNEIKEYKGTRFYERKGKNNSLIVFFHGNDGAACGRENVKKALEKTGANFIFLEYSGFADIDNNTPQIQDILQDVDNLSEYIKKKKFDSIFSYGRSLGTGPASYFASKNNADKLLLISPYNQLYKVAAKKYPLFPIKYLLNQNYTPEIYLKNYGGEVLIVHGREDTVIPFTLGKELFNILTTQKKEFMALEKGDHHNINSYKKVTTAIVNYLTPNK